MAPSLYVPSYADRSVPEQRIVEAAAGLPPGSVVTGWAALRLARAAYFDGLAPGGRFERPVLVAVGQGPGRRMRSGVVWSYEPLDGESISHRQGVSVTSPLRAVFDEMRAVADWREAVVALDMAAAARLVSVRRLELFASSRHSWRRSRSVARAVRWASERSRSPAESRLRLRWVVDAGLPPPLVNQPVLTRSGRLVCVADLFDPTAGLVVEYDGADHRSAGRHSRDVDRQERCRRLGLEYCIVTALDMHDPGLVVDRLRVARERALRARPTVPAWTLGATTGRTPR